MIEILQFAFMQRALIAGVLMGGTLALLGVFVVLRKSAFFGDAVAHFAFAGIALGFLLGVHPVGAAVAVSVLLALGIGYLQRVTPAQSLDTLIGIFFSGAAALGIFVIGLLRGYRADLFQFLFGDIIAIAPMDVGFAAAVAAATALLLAAFWRPLFRITFNRDMAQVSGVHVARYDYLFLALLALVTAVSIKIVGIILVPALLVVPAAAAKNISTSFRAMLIWAGVFGVASAVSGLIASFYLNTAAGATVVLASIMIFAVTFLAGLFGR